MQPFRLIDSGETMLVVEFGDRIDPAASDRVLALDAALRAAALPGVIETVPTFRSLAIHYEPLTLPRDRLVAAVDALEAEAEHAPRAGRLWTVPVCCAPPFGEDGAEAAGRLGLTPDALVERLCAGRYRLAMYGFAPGFAYLSGLDPALAISRCATPRPPHPPDALMIGGGMAAIASVPMPTGWWVIGRSAERMYVPGRRPEFLLGVGDDIRFAPVDAATFTALSARVAAGEIVARPEATA